MEYVKACGVLASVAVLHFCKHELMQAIWILLLDDDFIKAYQHGIVVVCGNRVTCHLFSRILIYSTDYPKKSVFSLSCVFA